MSQEKQLQMCTSGGGIRVSPRKVKPNKAPQRGLGVEKLEKIRLEEQRKNGGVGSGGGTGPVVVMPLPPPPPPNHHQYQPPPPVPFPPASLSDFTTSSAMSSTLVNGNMYGSPRATKPTSSGSVAGPLSSLGWSLGSLDGGGGGGGFSPKMLSSDSTMKAETELGLQNDPKPNWPPLGVVQWRQQHPNQLSSFMNPPLSSSSSSSGLNFQLEPPSNQNTYHNYMHPYAHEDHKMVGMKRPWPFSLDSLPDSISGNVASFASPLGRPDDSYGKRNPALREGPSHSHSHSSLSNLNWRGKWEAIANKRSKENGTLVGEFPNPNKRRKENGILDGNFLSLGLSSNPMYSSSTAKYNPPTFPFPPPDYHELSKIDVLSFHRNIEDQVIHQQQHSFLPLKEPTPRRATSTASKVELEDSLDLTLRL